MSNLANWLKKSKHPWVSPSGHTPNSAEWHKEKAEHHAHEATRLSAVPRLASYHKHMKSQHMNLWAERKEQKRTGMAKARSRHQKPDFVEPKNVKMKFPGMKGKKRGVKLKNIVKRIKYERKMRTKRLKGE